MKQSRARECSRLNAALVELTSHDESVRDGARRKIRANRRLWRSEWFKRFQDRDMKIRTGTVAAAAEFGKPTRSVLMHLIHALDDKNPWVRYEACRSLSDFKESGRTAIPKLLPLLTDWIVNVRSAAIESITQISASQDILSAVKSRLLDPHPNVRATAARCIAKFSRLPNTTQRTLNKLLHDREAVVRKAAIRTIGHLKIGGKCTEQQLAKLMDDPDYRVRIAASDALDRFAPTRVLRNVQPKNSIEYIK